MKDLWKKLLCALVLAPSMTLAVACGKDDDTNKDNTPETEQGTDQGGTDQGGTDQGGSGNQGGSDQGGGGVETPPVEQNQNYANLSTKATQLTDKSTASFEAVREESASMGMLIDEEVFLAQNDAYLTEMAAQMGNNMTKEDAADLILSGMPVGAEEYLSKSVLGFKGATGEGYMQNYEYDSDNEEYVLNDEEYIVKEAENFVRYYLNGGVNKEKEYVSQGHSAYEFMENLFLDGNPLTYLADNDTLAELNDHLADLLIGPFGEFLGANQEDKITATATIIEDTKGKALHIEGTITNASLSEDMLEEMPMSVPVNGTASIKVYFSDTGVSEIVFDSNIIADMTMEEEGLVVPMYMSMSMAYTMNFTTFGGSMADSNALAEFVGTGVAGAIEKARGGYTYNMAHNGRTTGTTLERVDFGETITPAISTAEALVAVYGEDNAEYYNLLDTKWYTDRECTVEATSEILNVGVAPSYDIDLYAKAELKSEYVLVHFQINGFSEGSGYSDGKGYFQYYLPVPSGETAVELDEEAILELIEENFGIKVNNSGFQHIRYNNEILDDGVITINGGDEDNIVVNFESVSYVDATDVAYRLITMTAEDYASNGGDVSFEYNYENKGSLGTEATEETVTMSAADIFDALAIASEKTPVSIIVNGNTYEITAEEIVLNVGEYNDILVVYTYTPGE